VQDTADKVIPTQNIALISVTKTPYPKRKDDICGECSRERDD
jgi:hypothetical protein